MRVLLDTSYLYNLMAAREQFSYAERLILTNQTVQLYVSAVSIWEVRFEIPGPLSVQRTGERL